jgi:hyperosmotically inducible periplasmic protein
MKLRTIPIATLALGLALAGCSKQSAKLTDSDLERDINARMDQRPELKDVKVSANIDKNEATISGTVATEAARNAAVDLAKASHPGLTVTDKIDVKPRDLADLPRSEYTEEMAREARVKSKEAGDNLGNSLDDAWIHAKITAKLTVNSATPARKINVDVVDQVVTLRGEVNSPASKREAEDIAKSTDGVKRVVNRLKIIAG